MANVSVSKAAVFEQRKRDGLQEQAIRHHSDALNDMRQALDALIAHQQQLGNWAERFSGMGFWARLKWLFLGR